MAFSPGSSFIAFALPLNVFPRRFSTWNNCLEHNILVFIQAGPPVLRREGQSETSRPLAAAIEYGK
jgi:hypothetical protein